MVLQGETSATGASDTCEDCGEELVNGVQMSAAGYYIGTVCECGPYSRESGYYKTREQAESALKEGGFGR